MGTHERSLTAVGQRTQIRGDPWPPVKSHVRHASVDPLALVNNHGCPQMLARVIAGTHSCP